MVSAYREHPPPPGLELLVSCLWERDTAAPYTQRIIPDGCLDLIWSGGDEFVVAGADTGPRLAPLPGHRRYAGLRLAPGAAGAVLGLPATELRDRVVDLDAVWPGRAPALADALARAPVGDRIALLAAAVAARGAQADGLVVAAASHLARPQARVAAVAAQLGVGERTLHRRTLAAVGYGPKVLARVMRLRRLMALADGALVERALSAGYASQAHMNEEIRRLTGTTPVRFLKDTGIAAA